MSINTSIIYLFAEAAVLTLVVLGFWIYSRQWGKGSRRKISVGEYTLVKQIGQGGMADIFLAQHRKFKNQVAMKILQTKSSAEKDTVKRFLMEGKNLQTISKKFPTCPIVKVHDYGLERTTGRYMIIMEYLPGENLKTILISEKAIALHYKIHIIKEVAKALQASHALKIFHRDVSPENIIVQGEKITLIDFGIAKEILSNDDQTDPGIILGKLNYISPEQFKGSKCTGKSDIYALGAVSFFLVEGKPPYDSPNPHEIILKHELQPVPRIKASAPEELKQFIYRMLGKNPGSRPDAGEVVNKMRYLLKQVTEIGDEFISRN